jgi:hypothetical protein
MDNLQEAYLSVYQELDEAMSSYERNRMRAAQRAAARNEARKQGKTGNVPGVGYVSPRPERETWTDESGKKRHKTGARMPENQNEEVDLFDYLLEYLVAEGYADTNENAIAIMANMSEEWRSEIFEKADNTIRLVYGKGGKGVPIKDGSGNVLRKPNVGFDKQGDSFRKDTQDAAKKAKQSAKTRAGRNRANAERYDQALKKGIEKATNRSDREPESGHDYTNDPLRGEPFANRNARRRRASGR